MVLLLLCISILALIVAVTCLVHVHRTETRLLKSYHVTHNEQHYIMTELDCVHIENRQIHKEFGELLDKLTIYVNVLAKSLNKEE